MEKLLIFVLCICTVLTSNAATLYGIVTSTEGESLGFTNVYVKGTTIGTSTNLEGAYSIKLDQGSYTIVFQHIGFRPKEATVTIDSDNKEYNVVLEPQNLTLSTFTINADAKDPAYAIIKKAIDKRKFHLTQVDHYNCDVYIKGLQKIKNAPKKILGQDLIIPGLDSSGSGIVYLSESISRLYYKKPREYKEVVTSSLVSGEDQGFSWNRASDLVVNFYESRLDLGLNDRGLVSPIAPDALLFYRYQLAGTYIENGITINKIKVIPRRKSDPVVNGYIHIQDDSWRINTTDFYLTKGPQIEIIDSLNIRQQYFPVRENVWLLQSQRFDFYLTFFKIGVEGNFTGNYSNYQVAGSDNAKIETPFKRNEKVIVEKNANKKDSMFWIEARPVELTTEELSDYIIKDSIREVINSKPYKDSIQNIRNKLKPLDILVAGYSYGDYEKKRAFSVSPLIENLSYNTVDGVKAGLSLQYYKYDDSIKMSRLYIAPRLHYGFNNNQLYPGFSFLLFPERVKYTMYAFSIGRNSRQINNERPINRIINSAYTLLLHENYMKLYDGKYISATFRRMIFNGFRLQATVKYEDRNPLFNTTDYSFFDWDKTFSPNNPVGQPAIENHQHFGISLSARIAFKQYYETFDNSRYTYPSEYPIIDVTYKKAIPGVFNSEANYDFLQVEVHDDFKIGLMGESKCKVGVGSFLNKENVSLIDYYHFRGNQTYFANNNLSQFQLMDYYSNSTTEPFVEGHYEHHFDGFVLNKFPLLRQLKLQLVGGSNAMYINENQNYIEVFGGIENIFKVGRIDLVSGLKSGNAEFGLRLSINTDF